jgi:hypothetical protein
MRMSGRSAALAGFSRAEAAPARAAQEFHAAEDCREHQASVLASHLSYAAASVGEARDELSATRTALITRCETDPAYSPSPLSAKEWDSVRDAGIVDAHQQCWLSAEAVIAICERSGPWQTLEQEDLVNAVVDLAAGSQYLLELAATGAGLHSVPVRMRMGTAVAATLTCVASMVGAALRIIEGTREDLSLAHGEPSFEQVQLQAKRLTRAVQFLATAGVALNAIDNYSVLLLGVSEVDPLMRGDLAAPVSADWLEGAHDDAAACAEACIELAKAQLGVRRACSDMRSSLSDCMDAAAGVLRLEHQDAAVLRVLDDNVLDRLDPVSVHLPFIENPCELQRVLDAIARRADVRFISFHVPAGTVIQVRRVAPETLGIEVAGIGSGADAGRTPTALLVHRGNVHFPGALPPGLIVTDARSNMVSNGRDREPHPEDVD